jgi:hypothetical protein
MLEVLQGPRDYGLGYERRMHREWPPRLIVVLLVEFAGERRILLP